MNILKEYSSNWMTWMSKILFISMWLIVNSWFTDQACYIDPLECEFGYEKYHLEPDMFDI